MRAWPGPMPESRVSMGISVTRDDVPATISEVNHTCRVSGLLEPTSRWRVTEFKSSFLSLERLRKSYHGPC